MPEAGGLSDENAEERNPPGCGDVPNADHDGAGEAKTEYVCCIVKADNEQKFKIGFV